MPRPCGQGADSAHGGLGETRDYESALLRRSFRKPDGTVGKQTVANLSMLPAAAVEAIEAVLKGKTLIEADAAAEVSRSLPHGHVALVTPQPPNSDYRRCWGRRAGNGTWPMR